MLKTATNQIPVIKSRILGDTTHGFFTRQGEVSTGMCHSLNCSFREYDIDENVRQNRSIAMEALSLKGETLAALRQVHGADVAVVDDTWDPSVITEADALVTKDPSFVLGIQTADCVPVLLSDPTNGVIGATHAGWRGALKGIAEATVDQMVALGAEAGNIVAAIGPCIAQDSYEVGQAVQDMFLVRDAENERFFLLQSFPEAIYFDLPAFVEHRLTQQGVQVERLPYDTYANEDLFFSCRRAQHEKSPGFGGHISLISLKEAHDS